MTGAIETLASLRAERDDALEKVRWLQEAMTPSPLIRYHGIKVARSERLILEALLNATGVLSADHLRRMLDAARPTADEPDAKSISVVICRLRKKLDQLSPAICISSAWGEGYHLNPDARAALLAIRYLGTFPKRAVA